MIIAEELDLPGREGARHARPRPARAAVQPAHRRLQHHDLDLHPDPGRRRRSPRARCSRPRRSSSATPSRPADVQGRRHHRARTARSVDLRRARREGGQPDHAGGRRSRSRTAAQLHGHRHAAQPGRRPATPSPGAKKFAMDLEVPGALPTMVCRPPTLNGTAAGGRATQAEVLAMPGVTDVAPIDTGVAVRAETFGQCIDAIRALRRRLERRHRSRASPTTTVLAELRKAELPLAVPKVAAARQDRRARLHLHASAATPRWSPTAAIADVRADRAEIWAGAEVADRRAGARSPRRSACRRTQVTVNVVTGGGSFGRKLFFDAALEAAKISKAMGKPVKLMWHRADEPASGPGAPDGDLAGPGDVRSAGQVLTLRAAAHQRRDRLPPRPRRDASPRTAAELPGGLGNLGFAETIFALTQELPYNFGVVTQLLNETDTRFNTGSMRNIYSPDVRVRQRAGRRPARAARWARTPTRSGCEFLQGRAGPGGARQGRRGGQWGRAMPRRHRAGHRDPQGVQGRHRLPGRDRLPARDRQPHDPRRRHRPAGHQGRRSPSTPGSRSTRAAWRPR